MSLPDPWPQTRLHLYGLQQAFLVILDEWSATDDLDRRRQLQRLADACVCEFKIVLRDYRARPDVPHR